MNPQPKPTPRVNRRKPLRRSKPIRRGPSKRQREKTPLERRFCRWLHTRPCAALGTVFVNDETARYHHVCSTIEVQQCHVRNHTGASLKPSELESFAGCKRLHDRFDARDIKGEFQGWTYEERKTWGLARAIEARFQFELQTGERLPELEPDTRSTTR